MPNRSIDIRENVYLHGEKINFHIIKKLKSLDFWENKYIFRFYFFTIAQNTAEPHYLAIISTYSLLIPASFLRLPMLMQEQKAAEHHPKNGL